MGVSTADLTGGWILESANFEIEDSGEIVELFGPNPTGAILFTEQGRMMAILTGNNRPATSDDDSKAKLFNSMMAYTGKFELSGDAFTTTVDTCWITEWLGTEQLRYAQLDGDALFVRTAISQHPRFPGRPGFGILKWRREH
jgi:lipocalin-like protein